MGCILQKVLYRLKFNNVLMVFNLMFHVLLQWGLVNRLYDLVTHYAFFAIIDIIREILSFIARLWMGL